MRLHGRPSRKRRERITLNLASMIDVTFLILIYFLLTTVLVRPEDRLTSALQTQSDEAAISDFERQVVEVLMHDGRPTYRLGGRLISQRTELAAALRSLPTEEGIFINVSDGVPVGFAVAAMQEAHNAGFDQVTYVPQR